MTQYRAGWNSTANPSEFTKYQSHTGENSLSVSNHPGPQISQSDSDNPLQKFQDFFGAPAHPYKLPYDSHDVQHEVLPQAYEGECVMLREMVIRTISATDEFWWRLISPLKLMPGAMEFNMDRIHFNNGMMDRLPEEAIAKLMTHFKESSHDYLQRYGKAILLNSIHLKTEEGQRIYRAQLLQLINAVNETVAFGVAWHILNQPPYEDVNAKYRTASDGVEQRILEELANFACLIKDPFAAETLLSNLDTEMTNRGVGVATDMIWPRGGKKYCNQPSFYLTGKQYDNNAEGVVAQTRGIRHHESRGFKLGAHDAAVDPNFRPRTIGIANFIHGNNLRDVPDEFYRTSMLDIILYSQSEDGFVRIPYTEAAEFSGLYIWGSLDDIDAPITPLGEDYFAMYESQTWGQYYKKIGVFGDMIANLLRKINHKETGDAFWADFCETFNIQFKRRIDPCRNYGVGTSTGTGPTRPKINNGAPPPPPSGSVPVNTALGGNSSDLSANGNRNASNELRDKNKSMVNSPFGDNDLDDSDAQKDPNDTTKPNSAGMSNLRAYPVGGLRLKGVVRFGLVGCDGVSQAETEENQVMHLSQSNVLLLTCQRKMNNDEYEEESAEFLTTDIIEQREKVLHSDVVPAGLADGSYDAGFTNTEECQKALARFEMSIAITAVFHKLVYFDNTDKLKFYSGDTNVLVDELIKCFPSGHPVDIPHANETASWEALFKAWDYNPSTGAIPSWMNSTHECQTGMKGLIASIRDLILTYCVNQYKGSKTQNMKLDKASLIRHLLLVAGHLPEAGTATTTASGDDDNDNSTSGFVSWAKPPSTQALEIEQTSYSSAADLSYYGMIAGLPDSVFKSKYSGKNAVLLLIDRESKQSRFIDNIADTYRKAVSSYYRWTARETKVYSENDVFSLMRYVFADIYGRWLLKEALKTSAPERQSILYGVETVEQLTAYIMCIALMYDHLDTSSEDFGVASKLPTILYVIGSLKTGDQFTVPIGRWTEAEINANGGSRYTNEFSSKNGSFSALTLMAHFFKSANAENFLTSKVSARQWADKINSFVEAFKSKYEGIQTGIKAASVLDTYGRDGDWLNDKDDCENISKKSLESLILNDTSRFGIQSAKFWKFQMRTHGKQAIGFVLHRPNWTHIMGSAIYIHGGGACTNTLMGHSTFRLGSDAARDLIFGQYTNYHKTVIHSPEKMIVVNDVIPRSYEGGGGHDFWDPNDMEGDMDDWVKNNYTRDIFACAVPINYKPPHFYFDITGRHHESIESQLTRNSDDLHYPSARIYAAHWKWTQAAEDPFNRGFFSESGKQRKSNTMVFRGYQCEFEWNSIAGGGSHSRIIQERAHFGNRVYEGVGEVRAGRKKFLESPNYLGTKSVSLSV